MKSAAIWMIYPSADRQEVAELVRRLAVELTIEEPPMFNGSIALPPNTARVTLALDKIEPHWRARALLAPPR